MINSCRFQARYKATNNVAADIRIHGVDGISFYELQWYLRDSIKPPEDAALQIMSTAHDERVMSVFDCMLYVRGSSEPNYKPRYRILEKTEPGEPPQGVFPTGHGLDRQYIINRKCICRCCHKHVYTIYTVHVPGACFYIAINILSTLTECVLCMGFCSVTEVF